MKNKRQAFIEGLSTGLKAPSGKGKGLIITHIGSDSGFVEGFVSNESDDYHKEINAEHYEKWFSEILLRIEPDLVVVIHNAPYHSRRIEQLPTTKWRKAHIAEWLNEKNITFDNSLLKVELLNLAWLHKHKYIRYAVAELAQRRGVILLIAALSLRAEPNRACLGSNKKLSSKEKCDF